MRQKALRSFPNRYLFSLYHKVTSSLSIRYILRIILQGKMVQNTRQNGAKRKTKSINIHSNGINKTF